jgi:hypothetical protein
MLIIPHTRLMSSDQETIKQLLIVENKAKMEHSCHLHHGVSIHRTFF